MHCEALSALEERQPTNKFKIFHHEDLLLNLSDQLREIFGSLDLSYSEKLTEKIAEHIPDSPTNSYEQR